jgi:hypothetical protein
MEIKYRFRQIRIDKALYIRIKRYCVVNDKKIGTFYEEVIQWFLRQLGHGRDVIYQASKQEDYLMTIRISVQLAQTISAIAGNEKVSDARVIFTANLRSLAKLIQN